MRRGLSRTRLRTCVWGGVVALGVGWGATVAPAAWGVEAGGYNKNFFVAFHIPDALRSRFGAESGFVGSVSNRFRINLSHTFTDALSVHVSYDLSPRVQDPALFDGNIDPVQINAALYRVGDLERRLYPRDDPSSFAVLQNLDRAFVTLRVSRFDFDIGRQAVAWGSARAINPTDVIAPFLYNDLDTEDRVGVDAIRARTPLGLLGELDGGYVFGEDAAGDKSAFFLRAKVYVARTDVTGILIGFRENVLAGLDIARSVGGAGVWLEAGHVWADVLGGRGRGVGKDYLRASLGADYSFGGTLAFIEYHVSGAGASAPRDYLANLITTAYTEGAVYLFGRHYLVPGFVAQVTPLLTLTSQLLVNLADPSALVAPVLEYNVATDVYMELGAFVGVGKRPRIAGGPEIRFRSEFGGYSDIFFTSFRVYL